MRSRRLSPWLTAMVVLLTGILWGALGTALTADKRLAVLEFQGSKVGEETLKTFTDAVRGGALEGLVGRGVDVMTRENMMAMLKAMGKSECTEGECEVETARNIGADYVVSGSVAHIEDQYIVTLKIHESKGGSLLATDMVKAKTQVQVLDQLREHGRDLLRASLGRSRSSMGPSGQEKRIEADGEFAVSDGRVLVKFESEPSGATVLLDGELLCKETPCSKSVQVGRHEVEMHKERYERTQQAVEVKKGTAVRLTMPANFATLVVATEPTGLPVAVDGKTLRSSSLEVDPAQHEVVIVHACYQRSGEQVVVKKGERREIKVVGSLRLSAIAVTAENERGDEVEASVAVDGLNVGNTPGTFKIGTCSKDIVVSSGTETFRSKLTLVEKETSQVRAKFAGDRGNLASSPGISAAAKVPSPPPAVSETEGSPGQGWRIAGLATAGAGVVGVGLGVYYGIKAKSLADELTSSSTFDASKDDARKGAINLQYVGYVAGGAALLGGVAMYYLLGDSGSRVAVAPQLTPHYAGISVRVGTR